MVLPRFLAELKHRNVYRAAVVYAAVGWMLLEAADVVLPRLGLPDWTVNLVLALILLGFPLAIVFAWIFDLSAQGIVRTQPVSPEAHHRFSFVSIAEFVLICALVATVGYLYVERLSLQNKLVETESAVQEETEVPSPEQYRAIAVLPFADMSEAGDQDWFAEGIAEELLIALSKVDELNVMARTSSFAFRNTDKTIAEIADILDVEAVLEGSVRRSGDRLRISAQLVDARSGYQLWSASYERELADIFQLQDELARAIVRALRVELGVGSTVRLVGEQTSSMEAYNYFMRGRALYDWSDIEILEQSISYFERAVEADPNYAQAWGYLALAQAVSMLWYPYDAVGPAVIAAYETALELDQGQSEALAVKAWMTQIIHKDWEAAGIFHRRAVESGENTNAILAYSLHYLILIDRIPLALRLYRDVEKRDPLHPGFKASLAMIHLFNGDAEMAARKAREALQLNPRHRLAAARLIQAYLATGNYSAVQQLLETLPLVMQESPSIKAFIGLYHLAMGDKDKARQIYQEVNDSPTSVGMMTAAALALGLGEVEESIKLQERVAAEGSWMQFWSRSPFFRDNASMRDNPRYQELLKRMGLDDESVAALNRRMSFE